MNADLVSKQTKILSDYLFETNYEDLPDAVLERAKLTVADTVGVAFKGSMEPEMKSLYERLPRDGKAVLLKEGLPKTNDIAMAGFTNATAICFVELDALSAPSGHSALHVLPPALALSQFLGKSGVDFLTAFTLGYEAHYRVQKATQLRKDVYPHGNSGHIGAIVAIGKLLDWNAEQFRQAINCTASLSLGTSFQTCFTDSTISSVFASFSSPIAFIVKDLIESGFTGYNSALGDTFGEILGEEFNPLVMTDGLGSNYDGIMNNFFKFHSTVGRIHPALEATADALNYTLQHDEYPPFKSTKQIDSNGIKGIKILTGDKRRENFILKLHFPASSKHSAKFSLSFAVAAYIVTGSASPDTISESSLDNKQIRSLEKLISLEINPNLNDSSAEVSIELYDGRVLNGKCKSIYGRTENPAKKVDLYNKFSSLTDGILDGNNKEKIWYTLNSIEKLKNMSEVLDI